ncbi:DJ-1/PfpI family protein [Abyssalbus ytuae]|uniref:DJ-1/PfpI family protein n=1 Tax=Abyssalbus ytuae TaxID=2926907 RepID=A0A9E6ZRA5_9FLAO|nr:DJ-1/PfpI family protein [Abyssalbus ytuae]UOB19110.1 DJ-1/PfpI family protein [Abyssalbus ytuae]
MKVGILLFEDFETLDVFGPVEILGRLKEHYQIDFFSAPGGVIKNYHGVAINTKKLELISEGVNIFIIPGGPGTRKEVNNKYLIEIIKQISASSKYVLTVCTGSALLAKTGLLNNRIATSNKRAFDWVITNGEKVKWIRKARWTIDDKYYTSSGVSAGMDMTLGFLAQLHGIEFARKVAFHIEYNWQEDKSEDNFSQQ